MLHKLPFLMCTSLDVCLPCRSCPCCSQTSRTSPVSCHSPKDPWCPGAICTNDPSPRDPHHTPTRFESDTRVFETLCLVHWLAHDTWTCGLGSIYWTMETNKTSSALPPFASWSWQFLPVFFFHVSNFGFGKTILVNQGRSSETFKCKIMDCDHETNILPATLDRFCLVKPGVKTYN